MKKFRLVVDGILIPFAVFVLVTLFISMIFAIVVTIATGQAIKEGEINAIFLQGIADLFIIAILVPYYIRFKKKYNVSFNKFDIKDARYIVPIAFSICIISNIFIQYIPGAEDNQVSKEIFALLEKYNIFVVLVIVAILVPIVEELIFRGFFFDTFKLLFNNVVAIIVTSILFAVVHMNLEQGLYALVAGAFLGYVKCKYNKLSYSIIMHLVMNFCSIIFVPAIMVLGGIKEQIFMIIICLAILIMTIYRMNATLKKDFV